MPFVERDGTKVAYDAAGSGPRAVVLSHNLLCDRNVFREHVARLAGRFRVLNVDARGHGESRCEGKFTTLDVARDLLAVLGAEKIGRATFVGVSLGATAAMEAALLAPDRVDGLVLLGASALASSRVDAVKNRVLAWGLRLFGTGAFVSQARSALFGRSFLQENPPALAAWEERFRALDRRGASRALVAWTKRAPLIERIEQIRARTLVVVGEEDAAHPPPLGEMIARAIPGAKLERLPRAGHTMTLERPVETLALIRSFLDASP